MNIFQKSVALLCVAAAMTATSLFAQDTACPFTDDAVVLYESPSVALKAWDSAVKAHDFAQALELAYREFDRADRRIEEKLGSDARFQYLVGLCKEETGESSTVRAVLKSTMQHIDGVIVTAEASSSKKVDDIVRGVSVTVVFDACPTGVDPWKIFPKEDVELTNEQDFIGSLKIKHHGEVKGTIYFGGSSIKNTEKYAFCVAGSQELLAKKLTRYANCETFAGFVTDEKASTRRIVRRPAIEALCQELRKKAQDDKNCKAALDVLEKVDSAKFTVTMDADTIYATSEIVATNDETAQNISDLINGAAAFLKLASKNVDAKYQDLVTLGEEYLKTIKSECDGTTVKSESTLTFDLLERAIKKALELKGN